MTVPNDIKDRSSSSLRRTRQRLLAQLPPLQSLLRGSLIERYLRCGKPGCKCAVGPGHGPKFYLSTSHAGERPQMSYVPRAYEAQVSEFLENYREVQGILEQISSINSELLRRRASL